MPVNSNRWNRVRYTIWSPHYDLVGRRFDRCRQDAIRLLALQPGERVLVVGGGTGGDLPYLPFDSRVLLTDLTAAMLRKARPRLRDGAEAVVMDGQQLGVASASFDAVVLHLVLAVIPDPVRCLRETARALRPGGRAVVFDKFVRGRAAPSLRALNLVTSVLFTDITRNFEEMLARSATDLVVERDEPALLGGLYRTILLQARK